MTTTTTLSISNINKIKRFRFDLDKTAVERWNPILTEFRSVLPELNRTVDELLSNFGISDSSWTYWGITKMLNMKSVNKDSILFKDELDVISAITRIPFTKLVIMQLLYEMSTACTCFITTVNHEKRFIRTMDWNLPLLKKITIELEVIKDGKTICIAPTWVGCVGFFTAIMPNKYAIAINYRRTEKMTKWPTYSLIQNVYRIISMKWPASYLVRSIATKQFSIGTAIHLLQKTELVAPCYFTVFDPTNNQNRSCVITRDINKFSTRLSNYIPHVIQPNISSTSSSTSSIIIKTNTTNTNNATDEKNKNKTTNRVKSCLYQTNIDLFDNVNDYTSNKDKSDKNNILYSKERGDVLNNYIIGNQNEWQSDEQLLESVLKFPIVNDETVYACLISATNVKTFT
jgi:hypothetical protein